MTISRSSLFPFALIIASLRDHKSKNTLFGFEEFLTKFCSSKLKNLVEIFKKFTSLISSRSTPKEWSLQKAKIIQSDECEILKLVLLFSKKGLPSFVMEKFIFFGLQSSYAPKRTLNPPLANIDTWA